MKKVDLHPAQPVLFMKIGIHAKEPLDEIIARKLKEIKVAGRAFWGYGGNTCHPTSIVQPFAAEAAAQGEPILFCMEKMNSNHWAEPIPADEYSIDGQEWLAVPKGIEVRGSRYALAIKDLRPAEFKLPLARAEVALGPSQGRGASRYVSGRVDKACLRMSADLGRPLEPGEREVDIGLVAELCEPYAVFLRNR